MITFIEKSEHQIDESKLLKSNLLVCPAAGISEPVIRNWSGPVHGTDFRSGPGIPDANGS